VSEADTIAPRSEEPVSSPPPPGRSLRRILLVTVLLIRPLMVLLALADVPRLWKHDGWSFYTGGDELEYFALAKSLADMQAVPSNRSLGYPILLAPIVALTGAETVEDIQPMIVLVQAAAGGALAVWLVYLLGLRASGSFGLAVTGAAMFALFPYWLLLPLLWPAEYYTELSGWNISYQLGLQPYADLPSQVFQLASALLVLGAVNGRSVRTAVAAGIVAGFAALIRVTNIPYAAGLAILPLAAGVAARRAGDSDSGRRQFEVAAVFAGTAAAVFAWQLVYNAAFFGGPLHWGYHELGGDAAPEHRLVPALALGRLASFFVNPAGMLWKSIVIVSLARFFWRCRTRAGALAAWGLAAYTLVLFAYPLFRQDPFRLAMPLIPYLMMAIGSLVYWPFERMRRSMLLAARSERSA
jgi:hypothetical protein